MKLMYHLKKMEAGGIGRRTKRSDIVENLSENHSACAQDTVTVPLSAENTRPLPAGSTVPGVILATVEGKEFDLAGEIRKKPSILIFYRGSWCPYCNIQLGQLKEIEDKLILLGYRVLAISADKPEKLRETIDKYEMKYQLLSDNCMEGAKAFGIAYKVTDEAIKRKPSFGSDLEEFSGEAHHILPVPSVFIAGTDGTIRYAYSNPDYKVRIKPEILLFEAKKVLEENEQ